ncbi:MAG: outer membrane lipoprotein-sorting protein [Fidelibacterota bacterium]
MKKFIPLFAGFLMVSLLSGQTGFEIAKALQEKVKPRDMKANLKMILTNTAGKTRTSEIRSITLEDGKKQIIWFLSPKDDRGVSFLKIEHEGKDDEMRLWLPAFKKVRRISSKKKGDSFMGSDMSYEDMTNRDLDDYTYELEGRKIVDGQECYILISRPKPKLRSTYSYHKTWITVDELNIVKEESYDRSQQLIKTKRIRIHRMGKYTLPQEIFVKNVQKNHSTLLTFDNIEVDTGVKESLFQEKYLKRLPQ